MAARAAAASGELKMPGEELEMPWEEQGQASYAVRTGITIILASREDIPIEI